MVDNKSEYQWKYEATCWINSGFMISLYKVTENKHAGIWRFDKVRLVILIQTNSFILVKTRSRFRICLQETGLEFNFSVCLQPCGFRILIWIPSSGLIKQDLRLQPVYHICTHVCRALFWWDYMGSIYQSRSTLIPAWISHFPNTVWDEITYPLQNFNGCTVEVSEWISSFIPHFILDVITYPCWD